MKQRPLFLATGVLVLAPVLAWAGPEVNTVPSQWAGLYAGAQLGLNQSNAYDLDTRTSLTGGVSAGYNVALPISTASAPVIVGGDVFAEFNGQSTHNRDVTYGSNVVGVDLMAGYPVGLGRDLLPYLKVGLGDVSATGDLSNSNTSARIGLGAQYRLGPDLAAQAQWMHQDAGHISNDNFTVGLNYQFSLQ